MGWWDSHPQRLAEECSRIRRNHPQARIAYARLHVRYCPICREGKREGRLHLAVFALLRTRLGGAYAVMMAYPCDFPNRLPGVWPREPLRPPPPAHQYSDGRLCLTSNEYDPGVTGSVVLGWAYGWLTCYEIWKKTGVFPPRNFGRHPLG